MKGADFLRRIRKLGRERTVPVRFDARHGKGSHERLFYGERFTTVKDRRKQIDEGLLKEMLRQLGLTKADIDL